MIENRGAMLTGLGIGAGLMFFLDPAQGRRRRALVRDQCVRAGHLTRDAAEATGRDMANRASGVAARLRRTANPTPVDDQVLVERVRAQMGRAVSHPRAIDVSSAGGVVTLSGPIPEAEVDALCKAVCRVKGVTDVVNRLDVRSDASSAPSLPGGGSALRKWQGSWTPTTRMVTALLATAGAGLIARSLSGQRAGPDTH